MLCDTVTDYNELVMFKLLTSLEGTKTSSLC